MNPNTSTVLTAVKYLPEKKVIYAEFSCEGIKSTEKFGFFPSLFLPITPFTEAQIKEIITENGIKCKIFMHENSVEIMAPNFDDLKKITNILSSLINATPLLIEPERQFLIKKDWSYFDSFNFSETEIEKTHLTLPKTEVEFLSYSLHETLEDALLKDSKSAEELAKKIAISNILKVPPLKVPLDRFSQLETLLENLFFRHKYVFTKSTSQRKAVAVKAPYGNFSKITEFDFSPVLNNLITRPFFNFGTDSFMCGCCKPGPIEKENTLPDSLVELEFKEDGIYFESFSSHFSQQFHLLNPNKEKRLARKAEYYLRESPVGPFFKNQKAYLPIPDASNLIKEKKAVPTGNKHLKWFCTKKESFISKEISNMQNLISLTSIEIEKKEIESFKNHGINAVTFLEYNPEHFYLSTHRREMSALLNSLIPHLTNSNSRFYSSEIADSINAIIDYAITKFSAFTSENGGRFIHSNNCRVFIESESPLALAMTFSEKENFPTPIIMKNHSIIAFH
ncbi:MAG: hypothetical protein V1672_01995 [Candidatus Diapherotrites archaeon]